MCYKINTSLTNGKKILTNQSTSQPEKVNRHSQTSLTLTHQL